MATICDPEIDQYQKSLEAQGLEPGESELSFGKRFKIRRY